MRKSESKWYLIIIAASLVVFFILLGAVYRKEQRSEGQKNQEGSTASDVKVGDENDNEAGEGAISTGDVIGGAVQGNSISSGGPSEDNDDEKTFVPECNGFIQVRGTGLYNTASNQEFQMVGINMDNNTWDARITPANRCMDETSYAEIKAMGFNTVRFGLAFHMTYYEDFYPWLDENIKWAKEAGLYVELDMHASQGGIQLREQDETYKFWSDRGLRDEFKTQWVEIATRYADETAVLAYDLLNEPLVIIKGSTEEAEELYFSYMQELINAIRKVDYNHIICVEEFNIQLIDGATGEAKTVDPDMDAYTLKGENLVMDCHSYSPSLYAMQEAGDDIPYDAYIVRDETWISNLEGIKIDFLEAGVWKKIETEAQLAKEEAVNSGVIKIEVKGMDAETELQIDEIIVNAYDSKGQFLREEYRCGFEGNGYLFSESGTGAYELTEAEGYGTILRLTGFSGNNGYTIKQTAKSVNGMFPMESGVYYQVTCRVKANKPLSGGFVRISIAGYQAEFIGNMEEYLSYHFEEYIEKMSERGLPVICNETGCSYAAMQNGGDRWLYESVHVLNKYGINYCLFAYTGKDFGLMYDSNRDFGTDMCKLRQESYDATYAALHQNTSYAHVFKNLETMLAYGEFTEGETVLVLGKDHAGVGEKYEYYISDEQTDDTLILKNGLYGMCVRII